MRPIDCLVIHHSASPFGSVEMFRREHIERGWSDIGYHAVIGNGRGQPDGLVRQGRPAAVKGSAVWGANTGKLHVCLVGNFEVTRPTGRQLASLGEWLLAKSHRYGGHEGLSIKGHKEVALPGHGTLCPGAHLNLGYVRKWFKYAWPNFLADAHYVSLAAFHL